MSLIERCRQLETLSGLLAECSAGGARAALVTGATATGKTWLLHAFAEQATGTGALFACATASRTEQGLPLGVLDQLLCNADLSSRLAESPVWLLDEGMSKASVSVYGRDPASGENAVPILTGTWINSLWKLLRDQAERGPLVIAIDNVHYADRYSLLCLSYLIRRLKSADLLVVLTKDVAQGEDEPFLLTEFLSNLYVQQIRLELLSRDGISVMLAERMHRQQAKLLTPIFYQASGGNPLLATALVDDYCSHSNVSPNRIADGEAFGAAVASCLYRCRPLVLEVARALAIIGEYSSASFIDELLEFNPPSSASAIEELTMMGLVEFGRFRQEAARKAVLDTMAPAAKTTIHRRAARLLREHGAASAVVAPHLVTADYADDPWSIQVLMEAADQASAEHELDVAIQYLALARKSCTDERQRAVITSALSCAEWRVKPSTAARHLADLCRAVRSNMLNRQHATRVILYLLWYGRAEEAYSLLRMLTRNRVPSTVSLDYKPPTEPDSLWPWLAWLYPDLDQELYGVIRANNRASFRKGPGMIADLNQVMEASSFDEGSSPEIILLGTLPFPNQSKKVASHYAKLLDQAAVRRVPVRRAIFSALFAMVNLRQGNLAEAKKYASTGLNLISPAGWGVAIGIPLSSIVLVSTMTGDYQNAATYLHTPIPEVMFKTPFGLYYLYARGRYHLAMANFDAALNDFHACGELMTRWGLDLPDLIPWRPGAAEAYLRLGMRQRAEELADAEIVRAGTCHHRARGISLRIRAALSDISNRVGMLKEAAELLNRSGDRVELAMALADLSQAHDELGENREARMMARRARSLADQCGVAMKKTELPDAVETEPDAAADRPLTGLSDAESRVATLAAQGYTNREISGKLYITVSTVEQHLTHVYKKLRVSRRTDLPLDLRLHSASG